MAIGDTNDMANRVAAVLPARWFPPLSQAPELNALLQGQGAAWSYCFALLVFTKLQARLETSTGIFIDLWADDWFGVGQFPRETSEADPAYIARIQANLFSTKGARPAFVTALTPSVGAGPSIIEPMNPGDTGGLGGNSNPAAGGGGGLNGNGLFLGSLLAPGQFFVAQPLNGNTDAQVYAEVAAQLPVGVTAWTEPY